jgi:1-acyl-sn-glycerol-3-phosphate acyltransferase
MVGAFCFFCLWAPLNLARRLWWRWTIRGTENLPPRPQGCVVAVNHLNWTDVHMVGASLPLSHRPWWIAKIELFGNSLLAWWFRQMQVIAIRRGKRDLAALTAAEDALRAGAVLIIFPEGHRSDTGQLQEGRSGAVRLAVRSGCPIVPMAIWGSEQGLRGAVMRRPVEVRFGEPYHPQVADPDHIPSDEMAALVDELMLRIAQLMPEQYWGYYREKMLETAAVVERA